MIAAWSSRFHSRGAVPEGLWDEEEEEGEAKCGDKGDDTGRTLASAMSVHILDIWVFFI
jgi:hypothetical protein